MSTENTASAHQSGDNDPNTVQRQASDPDHSIWVGASAGTGKTKVLTDRVLRLLLPRDDGRPATLPSRILCLTFTKAAANEMSLRITKTLSNWAVMDELGLMKKLDDLFVHPPTKEQMAAAQQLFADVIDCPGGLKIMTIHSFCQSVLGRFPVEAGLSPNFTIMDDISVSRLMTRAQNDVLAQAQKPENTGAPLSNAVHYLAHTLDEGSFSKLIKDVCSEKLQISEILKRYGGVDGLYAALCDFYNIALQDDEDQILEQACADNAFHKNDIREAADIMAQGKGGEATKAVMMKQWLDMDISERINHFTQYTECFLTQKGDMRAAKGFPTVATLKIMPQCREILETEGERLIAVHSKIKRIKSARMTRDIILVGHEISKRYDALKHASGGMDFDDLIIRTLKLLRSESGSFDHLNDNDRKAVPGWAMYKLDQGLDHILVDEAQDTNPEQWRIVEALCDEFFHGFGARDDEILRTSFTVGDIKQSIYSFQRAAPEEFKRMQSVFDTKIKQGGRENKILDMGISFRSTQSVLHVVDQVFADPILNEAVGGGNIRHISHREGQAGLVELWPVFESQKKEQRDFWDAPITQRSQESGSVQLANYIAEQIRGWLDNQEMLPAYNRPIEAGDILILVKSRSAIVDQTVRALKALKIPVSGADRMILTDQLVVQDLLSLARFCLLQEDDLALAELLKSPFIGWSEDELFSLSYGRKGSLWQELCNFNSARLDAIPDLDKDFPIISDEKREAARDYLSRLIGRARYIGAFEFFNLVLNAPCPADDHSGLRAVRLRLGDDALDPVDELLNVALDFTREHIDHLQIFLNRMEQSSVEIKRELEEQTGQVRIMTAHGSKGLQAPIVILPDTMLSVSGKKASRLLLPNKTNLKHPLYSSHKHSDPDQYSAEFSKAENLDEQEYYRLLYVAMTRAADRLYVAGYKGVQSVKEHSWYYLIENAMKNDPEVLQISEDILRIENTQNAKPDKAERKETIDTKEIPLPNWAFTNAPEEPPMIKPFMPSRPSEEEEMPVLSPLKAAQDQRFKRGNITHKLLQFLPDFESDIREKAARDFVRQNAGGFSIETQDSIINEVMKVLNNPEFAPFFAAGSMAEVSVTGILDDRIISGQIDRLVVTDDEIWIVDFKTNRPPPKDPNDIPNIYRKQLRAYRDTIREIYKTRTIHCALLWTDGPFLTILDN